MLEGAGLVLRTWAGRVGRRRPEAMHDVQVRGQVLRGPGLFFGEEAQEN